MCRAGHCAAHQCAAHLVIDFVWKKMYVPGQVPMAQSTGQGSRRKKMKLDKRRSYVIAFEWSGHKVWRFLNHILMSIRNHPWKTHSTSWHKDFDSWHLPAFIIDHPRTGTLCTWMEWLQWQKQRPCMNAAAYVPIAKGNLATAISEGPPCQQQTPSWVPQMALFFEETNLSFYGK